MTTLLLTIRLESSCGDTDNDGGRGCGCNGSSPVGGDDIDDEESRVGSILTWTFFVFGSGGL